MDDLVIIGGELAPVIPAGRYDAVAVSYRKINIHGVPKLVLDFDVTVRRADGEGDDRVRLHAYYNYSAINRGRAKAGSASKLYRDIVCVTGRRPPTKGIGVAVLLNALVSVEVRTVTHDHRQRLLPAAAQYSVVDRIVEVVAGGRAPHKASR